MIQHFHFWACMQKNWKQGLKPTFLYSQSQHHFNSQQLNVETIQVSTYGRTRKQMWHIHTMKQYSLKM